MNYEEKFKNLVAAIKKLQDANPSDDGIQNWVNDNVPELAEPEDEATWLKKYLEEEISCLSIDIRDDDDRIKLGNLKRSLDWLEKQGEQRVANSAKTCKVAKFKVGDWINGYYTNYKVLSVNNKGYVVEDVDGNKINILFENEKFHRLWTIQDARDGDVLACDNNAFLFSKYEKDEYGYVCCSYGGMLGNDEFLVNMHTKKYWVPVEFTCPATKEQRDLLFQKMKEAGYEWNAEELKLEKVDQTPAWNEEDENMIRYIGNAITCEESAKYLEEKGVDMIKAHRWLESHKPQLGQDWSEEDKRKLNRIYSILGQAADTRAFSTSCRLIGDKECVELQDFLKSLTHIPIEDIC